MNKSVILGLLIGILSFASLGVSSAASDETEGHDKAEPEAPARSGAELAKTCTACHGETGQSISPDFPNIGGQYASYLVYAMKGYRSGERNDAVMQSFVNNLSDQEIKNLAEFYAAQSGLGILAED